jgi:hypothetical protein
MVGAVPVVSGQTGTQAFCASQDGVIKYERTGSFEDCRAYGNPLR